MNRTNVLRELADGFDAVDGPRPYRCEHIHGERRYRPTHTRSEDLLVNTTPFGRQTYETWSYDANNLVERYTRASVVKNQNLATGCYPDALTAPRDDWRYRYAPFMEREQKRQYELSSGEYQLEVVFQYVDVEAKSLGCRLDTVR